MKKTNSEIVDFICDELSEDGISILGLSYVSLLRRGYDLGYVDAECDFKRKEIEKL